MALYIYSNSGDIIAKPYIANDVSLNNYFIFINNLLYLAHSYLKTDAYGLGIYDPSNKNILNYILILLISNGFGKSSINYFN